MLITRSEAIKATSLNSVEKVEAENVDFTNRVTDGTNDAGYSEFSASVKYVDKTLTMFVFVDSKSIMNHENLDDVDWEKAISNAEFEII